MARLSRAAVIVLLAFLQCFAFDFIVGDETGESDFVRFDDIADFVVKTFNERPDALYQYKSARIITGLKQNDTGVASYSLRLDLDVACNRDLISQAECFPKHLLCRVVIMEDPGSGEWKLRDEATNCQLPEADAQQNTEDTNRPTPSTQEQRLSDVQAMMDDLGPFLMTHLNPLSESIVAPTVEQEVAVSAHKLGAPTDLSHDADGIEQLVEKAMLDVDARSYSDNKYKLVLVEKAQRQVTNKVHVYLTLVIGETSCSKSSEGHRSACELRDSETRTCYFDFANAELVDNNCTFSDNNQLDNNIVTRRFSSDVFDYLDGLDEPLPYGEESPSRTRREIGSLKNMSSSEKQLISDLAQLAVATLDEIDADDSKRVVLEVLDAKKQLVNGVMYHLKLRVGTTACDENGASTPACLQDQVAAPKICVVHMHRSFAADSPNDVKVVKSECSAEPHRRHRRQLVGGYSPISVSDPTVQTMASFAVSEIDKTTNSAFKQHVVRVVKAETQVVAGTNYKLTLQLAESTCRKGAVGCPVPAGGKVIRECNVTVFDQPWTKTRSISDVQCGQLTRVKRQVGGYSPISVRDPTVQAMASFAVSEIDKTTNSAFKQHVVRVVKAEKQVVSGTNYKLTLELAESTCRKGAVGCPVPAGGKVTRVCTVTVFDQPWTGKRSISNVQCQNRHTHNKREALLGGPRQIDVKDPELQPLAQLSLAHIEAQSNALYSQQIVRIVSASRQVVAGLKYTITMEVGYTSCRKPSRPDVCQVSESSNNQLCTAVVWTRPWLKDTQVTSASCSPVSTRSKRSLIGGGTHDIHIGLFRQFQATHGKTYSDEREEKRRFHIFRANMKKVETLQKTEQGTAVYGPTKFADLTSKEFKKFHLGLNPSAQAPASSPLHQAVIPDVTLPTEFDWRHYNVVTPVKNQGGCGSCWAFSVTGNVEGQWALRHQELLSLSEQELVDCDKLDSGCEGGLPSNAYSALASIGGLESERDYPYDGADEKCHFNKTEVKVTITGGLNITKNETQMAQWLLKNGPISIGINANAMQFYMGGVSHPWKFLCNSNSLDHGVLIVGFGVHNYPIFKKSLPYWIVKNSWGESWGEQGYYRVYRGDGTCGVNEMATSAIVG